MRNESNTDDIDDFDYLFKIVFIGDAGVGKSALVHRFRYNVFVGQLASTIGVDFILRSVNIDGKKIKVQLLLLLPTTYNVQSTLYRFNIRLSWVVR